MKNTYCYKHNPIVKKIFLSMLTPTIFMNLTTAIASMADTIIIGHYLDDASLSVVTFTTPIYLVINMFSALFAVGGCIAMSIDSGRGEKDNANKAFSIAVELMLLMSALLVLGGLFFSQTITGWLGAQEDVFDLVEIYSRIILLGGPIFILSTGLAFFVRNDGRPTLSMVGMFSSIFIDIVLNFVFVGFMGMGVSGAAYSTVIGRLVGIIIIGSHFFSSKNTLKFRIVFDSTAVRIVKNGGSAALQFVYQFFSVLIINHFLAKIAGTNGVVIYTVVFNLATVALSLFEGISQTIQPMISNYYGEKSFRNIKEVLRLTFITIVVICGTVTIFLEAAPQFVPIIFGIENADLMAKASIAVRIYSVSMIITTVNVVIGYYLQSTERNFMAAVMISLRSFIIFLSATFILGKMFGMNGIWAAYTVAEVLSFIVCIIMVRIKQKKLEKEGIHANIFLLDETVEKKLVCYTYDCKNNNYTDFLNTVFDPLEKYPDIDEYLLQDAKEYLAQLENGNKVKNGKFIEIELNVKEKKIIIRDNLNHTELQKDILDSIKHGSKSEYGPVLGWNRICLE